MTVFEAADTAADPGAIRAAAAELDLVAGRITGHGAAVGAALDAIPAQFSDLVAPTIRAHARQNEAAWRQALSSVVFAAGVTRMWAGDVEWFKRQRATLTAQVAAATSGTAGLTPPAPAPDARPEVAAAAAQQFSVAVENRRAELAADGSRAGGALLQQLRDRAADRAADLRSGPTPVTLSRLAAAGALPASAGVIFAGTGWAPPPAPADLVAMVAAGLLPGSALHLSWSDLIARARTEWAHLLDRVLPTIPDGSPLAGIFRPAVDPLTMGPTLRADPATLGSVLSSVGSPMAMLLGALYPRLLARADGVPALVRAVAGEVLNAARPSGGPGSSGGGPLVAGAMPADLSSTNTSLIGRLASKVLSNDAAATGYVFLLTAGKNLLAGKPWPGPGPAPWEFNAARHNAAVGQAVLVIKDIAERGGNPLDVTTEYKVPGARKEADGSFGKVDIVYRIDPTENESGKLYFWEVKGSTSAVPPLVNPADTAAAEVAHYISYAKNMPENVGYDVVPGEKLNTQKGFFFEDPDGVTRYYVVRDGDGAGAIVYGPGSFVGGPVEPEGAIRQDLYDVPLWARIADRLLPFPTLSREQLDMLLPYGSFADEKYTS